MKRRPRPARTPGGSAWALVCTAVATLSCTDLQPIASGVCGNYVVDPLEDCDRYSDEPGTVCARPKEEHACRFVCLLNAPCPSGYGCGGDHVCRRASSTFAALGDLVPFPSLQGLVVGDFDADGAADALVLEDEDALGRRAARLVFAGGDTSASVVVPVPFPPTAVCAGALDSLASDDIGLGDLSGVAVLQGRPDRAPQVTPFPSVAQGKGTRLRGLPLEVIPGEAGDEMVAFVQKAGSTETAIVRPPGQRPEAQLAVLAGNEEDIAGSPAAGRFDENSPCAQIVLAFRGAANALLFYPCRIEGAKIGWNENGKAISIALPPGVHADAGIRVADLDKDNHLDLLIGANGGSFVAWGNGDGSFTSMKKGGKASSASEYPLPMEGGGPLGFPLAIADLSSDGVMDFVMPTGVVLSNGNGYILAYENSGAPWNEAVAADFNDNGLVDIAASTASSLDVDFLNNAGGGKFNPALVGTEGAVEHLAAGDFDGDLVTDLAFSEAVDDLGVARDVISVGFGNAHGPPSAPVRMAILEDVSSVSSGHLPGSGGIAGSSTADDIADLVVESTSSAGTDALFEFQGSASRVLVAELTVRFDTGLGRPLAMAAGQFGDPSAEIVVLGADPKTSALRFYLVETADSISLDHIAPSSALLKGFHSAKPGLPFALHYGALLAAGDLDGNGVDEVVFVAPWGEEDSGAGLLIADYDAPSYSFKARKTKPFHLPLSVDSELFLRDVDGNGTLDAVVLGGSDEAPGDILVLWNDGNGDFDVTSSTVVHVEGGATGVACLPARNGKGCNLVVLTRKGTFLADTQNGFAIAPLSDLPGGRAVATGDFDDDGVVDLAIGDDSGLRFIRVLPEIQ